MNEETVVWNKKDLKSLVEKLIKENDVEEPLKVIVKDYKPRRSLKANSLYWMWLDYLAREFTERSEDDVFYTKEDLHDICRHKFLGYKDKKLNKTVIKSQLVETSKLDKGDFFDYMTQIDDWCLSMKKPIKLPRPEKNEYDDLRRSQKGG